ncbi:uncharacterized mitochondrial protein-like protein [Tanacetum coccineum]
MMLESIENGPLVYPTIEEDGKIRNKKYAELTEQEKLQDDCDVQATNIVLQGLPPDCLFACFLSQEEPKKMDVKSAFLYGKIEEEIYVCQPPGFEDPNFPDRVYKVEKFQMSSMGELTFFLGLQVKQKEDGIFISQDKYVTEILKKFGFTDVKTASTPMETQKPLLKDEDLSACARYQVNPKASHLHAAKRTFRYLKGASLDRKSTTGEAEYVAASSCRGQVLWTQNQLLDYGDSNEKKLIQMIKIHTDKNVVDLLTKAFDESLMPARHQLTPLWQELTTSGERNAVEVKRSMGTIVTSLVDGKKIVVTEASVRRDLQLDEEEGTDCLPNATIFEELTRMGAKTTAWNEFSSTMASTIIWDVKSQKNLCYTSHTKKIFANMRRQGKDFSGRETPLFPTMIVQAQEEMGEGSTMPTDPHHTPIITQPSSSQPQKKQKSRSWMIQEDHQTREEKFDDIDADIDILPVERCFSTASTIPVSAATITEDEITLAQALAELKSVKPKVTTATTTTTKKIILQSPSESITTTTTPFLQRTRGKGIMVEEPTKMKKKDQISYDQQEAMRLQAESKRKM